ncbi:tyrosine-protein phosphatase non-receptor type 21-like isoform X2 [Stegodyphus dumicola]|uniref:tyrosine-protein phosphatase non-receptor type 21-like isoform X2 n=1 Tax=Stegodyphus dumicola TaxID=202533 RepID=UPI0015B0F9ED|nr:tyrosine-protein phosphatase non-receptor type 21-like isoform X2 [Stegodyphus dumicola]
MPFKIKLKKSRQYNVSSKNLFVLSVELLDNTTVECTLSSQSLGQECLNNVCQRLGLQQSQYFGLRFLSKKGTYWWVDLQRPLKKQLDKYALESCNLYLGVMFFVADVNILHDEVTRYHYFLQLKSDILEGKLHCNEDQTILFASYSLQAEFGDHDPERHTTEYLTNFGLLPKQMAQGKENQEAILERVILNHRSLQGMSQQLAEVYYIMEAQRLNGYGLECFAAKDHSGNAIIVGVSLMGIYIWYLNNQPSIYFPWDQIINLVHQKRCFGIEHRNSPKVLQTYLEDSHLAKYVWKTCIQQHCFYTKNEGLVSSSSEQQFDTRQPNILSSAASVSSKPSGNNKNEQTNSRPQVPMQESQESLDGLGIYHTDSGCSEIMPSSNTYSQILEENRKADRASPSVTSSQSNNVSSHTSSSTCLSTVTNSLQPAYSQPLPQACNAACNDTSQLRRVSLSDVSVHQHSHISLQETKSLLESKPICSVLPMYRQAPDYDTAVKLKYGIQSCSTSDMSSSHSVQPRIISSGSQVDVSHLYTEQNITPVQSYSQYKHYADLSHLDINELSKNINVADSNVLIRNQEHFSAPNLHPPVHTYSSPDLASQAVAGDFSAERILNAHVMYQFKPPPPYPYKQRSSSSTPDLTRNNPVLPPPSSPDVILHKNVGFGSNPMSQNQNLNPKFQIVTSYPVNFNQQNLAESIRAKLYEPTSVGCAKIVTSSAVPHQTIASSHKVGTRNSLPIHTYQNYNPQPTMIDSTVSQLTESTHQVSTSHESAYISSRSSPPRSSVLTDVQANFMSPRTLELTKNDDAQAMGPMLIAAMNGLSLSRPDMLIPHIEETRIPNDTRIQALESRLAEGQVFLEFERIIKKKPNADFSTAILPENMSRNRFKDVFPYEENRVRLTPTTENKTGYINASHLSISLGTTQRFYIAAQGPLPNTLYSFWQMIWEHHVSVIVMLTEVQEQGRDKCFPYWPQEDLNKLQIGEFQIVRNFSMSSSTYVTCSLSLCHITSHQRRSVWHIQYTDWPDHSCPQDVRGFIAFMGEVDAVRRHATANQGSVESTSPVVVHCSAGVGRSGAVILCDIMLHFLDHNQPIDLPKVLTHLRLQRMLTVQTLAQYKFVYIVLIQYLKNSRLI